MTIDDSSMMERALALAAASYRSGGCPIGSVLVDNQTGAVLGEGHNRLVQESNPILHGEMDALRHAGRVNRHNSSLFTTLQPCFMCAGAIVQFRIARVVIADTTNATSRNTIDFMREHGVEVTELDQSADVARRCIDLARRFKQEQRALWDEDWGLAAPGHK